MSSRLYVENRIREALKKARGNKNLARQQIIAWTYEDAKLLHGLTRAHLDGIISYNIDRLLSGRGSAATEEGGPSQPAKKPQASTPAPTRKSKIDDFGMELLRAVAASDATIFGQESNAPPQKRGQASRRHVDALMKMASSVQNKKSDTDKT